MNIVTNALVIAVAIFHLWFMILEMFLWRKPMGLKTFNNSVERAETTAVLAANQGLYNGFLAGGLLISFLFSDPAVSYSFKVYFLSCVVIAGVYGACTANRKILFVQALPAILALISVILTR
jgi:putative membrane protein